MKKSLMKAFDSFAWIEYLKGSQRGAKAKEYVESIIPIYTPSICLTEIKSKYLREGKDPKDRIDFILERTLIIDVDHRIALKAAEIKNELKLHTVDALVYAAAQAKGAPLVTGDPDFKNLPNVEIL